MAVTLTSFRQKCSKLYKIAVQLKSNYWNFECLIFFVRQFWVNYGNKNVLAGLFELFRTEFCPYMRIALKLSGHIGRGGEVNPLL